jgi:2-phospho-L-lactate guanylyltransferase
MSWVVIPFRGPEGAKTRLADAIPPGERQALARAMFQHVLGVACSAAGPNKVLVVTTSKITARLAKSSGASVLRDRGCDLNQALCEARDVLRQKRAASMTIVAADLPLLKPDDIMELMDWAHPSRVMVAIDRKLKGTNGLTAPINRDFTFRFGPDSALAHAREARSLNLAVRSLRQDRFAADVDTPADLEVLSRADALAALPSLPPRAVRRFEG